jgi:hypothetical protein
LEGTISGAHPITKTGGGNLKLAADNSGYTQSISLDNGELILAGDLGSPISIATEGIVTGFGSVGALAGVGTLRLDQTVIQSTALTGLVVEVIFRKSGAPLYGQASAASNGVVVLPANPAFLPALDIYLGEAPVAEAHYRGGFFVPFATHLAAALTEVPIRLFAPDASGGHAYLNEAWTQLTTSQITTVAEAADFGSGPVNGRTIEVRVGGAQATFAAWQAAAFPNPADLSNPAVSGPCGREAPGVLRRPRCWAWRC